MRYGIFSDVHGNLEALLAVVAAFLEEAIDAYLCLGDVVGYGANPNECIEQVEKLGAITIAGNHDQSTIDKLDVRHFNPAAKEAVSWTRQHLDKDKLEFLQKLPFEYKNKDLMMVHGTLPLPEKFFYLYDLDIARQMFAFVDRPVCFVGHTHAPKIIAQHNSAERYVDSCQVNLQPEHKYIVNVGSVGQPRDTNPQTAYCIYDTELNLIEIKRIDYPVAKAQEKIIQAGLPRVLAARLAVGG